MDAKELVDEVLRGRAPKLVVEQGMEQDMGAEVARPRTSTGLTAVEALEQVMMRGELFSQEESNYKQPGDDPEKVCGNCRFFLRDEKAVIGKCQVVDGAIAWFGTSDLFIDAKEESVAAFAAQEVGDEEIYGSERY